MNRFEEARDAESSPVPSALESIGIVNAPVIPDHRMIGLIATGAYGEVWLGCNAVGTPRAIKVVRRDRHASIESFEREFKGLQQFEPISRSHEGLVDILTLGMLPDSAGFYYVMELADDAAAPPGPMASAQPTRVNACSGIYRPRTLSADFKWHGAFPASEVLALGLKIARALAHLHGQGLVHRDVKPSNILFIDGEPKLADPGLVARVDEARSLVGTAGYIAPEGPGTPQADLYALGKVLYQAAFGKDRHDFPALPGDVASRSDHKQLLELNSVILRASATDQRERYKSAEEMLADLAWIETGGSVQRRFHLQRRLRTAVKLGTAGAALAIAAIVAYSLVGGRMQRTPFHWSKWEEANREYLDGIRVYHSGNDAESAIKHFQAAIKIDPQFAEAYARLAGAWINAGGSDAIPRARKAAEKALSLKENLAAAHSTLATVRLGELDWAAADRERARAVDLDPNSEEVLLESALNLAVMGRPNEALDELARAQHCNGDAGSQSRFLLYGFAYAWCRQFDRAIEIYEQFPHGGSWMHEQAGQAFRAKGDYTNAVRMEKLAAIERGEDPVRVEADVAALEHAFKSGGAQKYWELELELEKARAREDHLMRMATVYAQLGQLDETFKFLRRALLETPANFSMGICTNPAFDRLRVDPRMHELMDRLWRKR